MGKREIDRRRRVIELGDDRGSFAAQGMALRSGTSLRFHRLPTTGTLVSVEIYPTTLYSVWEALIVMVDHSCRRSNGEHGEIAGPNTKAIPVLPLKRFIFTSSLLKIK